MLMAWLNYSDGQGLLPLAVCAAAAHELGHWTAVRMLGGRVTRLRLSAAGAEMQLAGAMGYRREIVCVLAGPAVNLVLALVLARMGLLACSGLNLAMGLFNLLPLRVLDGGRALACVACILFGPERALGLMACVEWVLSALLLLCAGAVLGLGGNVTLLVVSVWLFAALGKTKDKTWRKKGLSRTV